MFGVKIKCLCLKYVEIDQEKCPKHPTIARIATLSTQIIIHVYVNNSANSAFYDAIYIIQFD